jgi:hypothetical protein
MIAHAVRGARLERTSAIAPPITIEVAANWSTNEMKSGTNTAA